MWWCPPDYGRGIEGRKHTNSSQHAGDGSIVGITGRLVLSQDTTTDTLDNTDLGGLLVVQLTQAEGELAELLNDLRQGLSGAGTLETVGGGGTAVQSGTVGESLDLSGTKGQAKLDTPDFTNVGKTLSLHTGARREDDLLLGFNLVALELPASGVLDNIAVVDLSNLLDQLGDLSLGRRLLSGGLLLLLLSSTSQESRGDHESQEKLVGVVGSVDEVSFAAGHHIGGRVAVGDNNHVANNGSKAINLGAELDLDDFTSLQGGLSLRSIRHQGGVGRHIGARGDSRRVGDTFPKDDTLICWFENESACSQE